MRSRAIAPLLFALLVATASGCASDDVPGADADPAPTATTSATTGGRTDSPADVPAVEPASGEKADLKTSLSLRVPAEGDWYIDDGGGTIFATATVGGGVVDILASDVLSDSTSIDESAVRMLDTLDDQPGLSYRRVADTTVSGVEGWVIEGEGAKARFRQFGTLRNGRIASIDFTVRTGVPPADAEELIASVLASVEWK
ncbi:MAG: hypothetical protein NTX33_18305 [Propionibacteriales bacterium]|nr:hypothetical protein [Propionibacteriales bacterium]